jgi:hypothetical protein
MTRAITNIYEIESNTILTGICDATIVSGTSKTALSALKAIPGLNVAAAMLNGIVAGVVTMAIGEAAIILCEKVDAGELSDSDKESISKIMSEQGQKQLQNLLGQLQTALSKVDIDKLDVEKIKKILTALIKKRNTKDIASE